MMACFDSTIYFLWLTCEPEGREVWGNCLESIILSQLAAFCVLITEAENSVMGVVTHILGTTS